MTELQVYLWLMLDNIKGLGLSGPSFACLLGGVVSLIAIIACNLTIHVDTHDDDTIAILNKVICIAKKTVWLLAIPAILGLLLPFVPTSKQYAMIKVFPKVANSEMVGELQNDVPEMYQMAKEYMKSMLSDKEV